MRKLVCLVAAALLFAAPAWAADALPKGFYGSFSGTGLSETQPNGKVTKVKARDFDVNIVPHGDGFTMTWNTTEYTIRPFNSSLEKDKAIINFLPTSRPGVFKTDLVADVTAGEPVYWAILQGNTLMVYRLVTTEKGKFEIAVWTRTLIKGDKLQLEFHRYGTASPARVVKGTMSRVPDTQR